MCVSATVTTGGGPKKPQTTVFGQAVHLAELKQSRAIEFTRKSMQRLQMVSYGGAFKFTMRACSCVKQQRVIN